MGLLKRRGNQKDPQVKETVVSHAGPLLPIQRVVGGNGPRGGGSTPGGHETPEKVPPQAPISQRSYLRLPPYVYTYPVSLSCPDPFLNFPSDSEAETRPPWDPI